MEKKRQNEATKKKRQKRDGLKPPQNGSQRGGRHRAR